MEQLASARLLVAFEMRLLDSTLLTAERAFNIQNENISETTDRLPMSVLSQLNSPFFSENKRYFKKDSHPCEAKMKLRPKSSSDNFDEYF